MANTKLSAKRGLKMDTHIRRLLIIMVCWFIFMGIMKGRKFYSVVNFQTMFAQFPEFGLMSLGVMVCMISSGIDLSTVGVANMTSITMALLMRRIANGGSDLSPVWVLPIFTLALLIGAAAGLLNGVLIAKLKLPPFIATLGTQMMSMGFGSIITKVQSQTWPTATAEVGGWFKKVFIRAELFGIKGFVKILSAPQGLLMPIILCMCCVGAFGCSNRMFDVWCLLIFGLIAVVIRAMELPIMPVAIGFILGPIFEKNLRRAESFMTSGPAELLHHPIALVILVITVVMIIFSLRSNKRAAEREAAVAAAEEQE